MQENLGGDFSDCVLLLDKWQKHLDCVYAWLQLPQKDIVIYCLGVVGFGT